MSEFVFKSAGVSIPIPASWFEACWRCGQPITGGHIILDSSSASHYECPEPEEDS